MRRTQKIAINLGYPLFDYFHENEILKKKTDPLESVSGRRACGVIMTLYLFDKDNDSRGKGKSIALPVCVILTMNPFMVHPILPH